jgi:HlyD family secretion protein
MTRYIILVMLILLFSCGKKIEETKPIRKDVTETVFASGVLEAYETYSLTAQSDGYLSQISFKENDIVKQGQVLAVIDNKQNTINTESANTLYKIAESNTSPNAPLLAQAQNEVMAAKKQLDFEEQQYLRYKKLWNANSIAKTDFENSLLEFEVAKKNYDNTKENYSNQLRQAQQQVVINKAQKNVNAVVSGFNQIKSVFKGRVYQKLKQKGDFVKKGDIIAVIGAADFVYAKVSIDESSVSKVKEGQQALIQLNTNKQKTYKAVVKQILPAFDQATQSFICSIYFTDTLDFNIINTQLQVNIITGVTKNALLIPRNYLGYGNLVKIKGKKEPVKVETKFVSSDWVQVVSGLEENSVITTDNIIKK